MAVDKQLQKYVDGMKTPGFNWEKNKWRRCHGDGKSTVKGAFFTQTFMTDEDPPVYKVQIVSVKTKKAALGFNMPAKPNNPIPTNGEVLEEIKQHLT